MVRPLSLTADQAETLQRDGVIHLPRALDAAEMAQVEDAFAWTLENPGPRPRVFYPDSGAKFFEAGGDKVSRPRYLDIARRTGIGDVVRTLWDGDESWYLGEQIFLKEGGFSRRTPWRQDTSYGRMAGEQLLAVWVSLDPLPKEHALEVVRGSHHGTLYNVDAFDPADDTAPLYANGERPRLPNIEAERDAWDIVSWDTTPGDLVIFNLGTLHGGAGTVPGLCRRTVSMRFIGPDVVYEERPEDAGAKAGNDEILGGIYAGLNPSDPFRRSSYPLV
jgi:hypothetical protein